MTTSALRHVPAPGDPAGPGPAADRPAAPARRRGPGAARVVACGLVRGADGDPRWVRPALLALLAGTAVLYLWDLAASGWANSFYSAAAQAGSVSWKAYFFGSSDAANSITVDKTPASLWVMAMSVRLFGLSSWSVLVPQALMGVGSVGLLCAAVRRVAGPGAGLLAGLVLAITPVATLMFRFNNPDALLVLLMVGAAYATVRAVTADRPGRGTRWLIAAGALIGVAFLTKMLQALLVVPGLAAAYLVAAPVALRRRLADLLAATAALVVAGGWWVAIVQLVPAADRPFIGGSQHNSVLELMLGYNGFGRLTGDEVGSVGGSPGGGWGVTGWTRLFSSEMGGQIAWLLPAALVALVAGFVLVRGRPRTDPVRASLLVWGGWLVVTGLVFSFMQGIVHPYYTVALAPAIAALVGTAGVLLWRRRDGDVVRVTITATVLVTAFWAAALIGRDSSYLSWLPTTLVVGGLVAAGGVVALPWLRRGAAGVVLALVLVTSLAGPAAYALTTAGTAHTGAIVSAGPSGGLGGLGGPGGRGGPGGARPGGTGTGGFRANGGTGGGFPGFGGGTGSATGGFGGFAGGRPGGAGGMGGLLDAGTPGAEVVSALRAGSAGYTWVAATVGSNSASGYQLATQLPVMAIGGFNGTDPAPTLARFQQYVAAGRIHYFVASGGRGFGGFGGGRATSSGGSADATEIGSWVAAHYTARTVDGVTLYDLTAATT